MIKKIIIFSFLFLTLFNFRSFSQNSIFIAYKVNNQIITNIDIKDEAQYLLALNNQLSNLGEKQIYQIAKNSIIKEKIKKIELLKYYDLGGEKTLVDSLIKNFYLKLGLTNQIEFEAYLQRYNLKIDDIRNKVEIEATWNNLIYTRYKNLVNVDIESLQKKLSNEKKLINKKSYLLSEILIEKSQTETFKEKFKKIEDSIKEIGFKNTANIYSISDSAKFGGDIGWVDEGNLSKKISTELLKIKINEHTVPLQFNNNFLIIKIEDIKNEKIEDDNKKTLDQMIQFETNKQLDNYSKIYYNKVKINTSINEL